VLLEVLLGGGDELDGRKLEATVLEAGDDGTDEAALLDIGQSAFFLSFVENPAVTVVTAESL
jgi:hypothetical protein